MELNLALERLLFEILIIAIALKKDLNIYSFSKSINHSQQRIFSTTPY